MRYTLAVWMRQSVKTVEHSKAGAEPVQISRDSYYLRNTSASTCAHLQTCRPNTNPGPRLMPYAAMHDVQPNVNINVCSSKLYIPQHEARPAQLPIISPSTTCDRCFAVKRLRNRSVRNFSVRTLRC